MKKILTILIAISSFLLSTQPGLGAEVYLSARVGFGGYVVPGALTPVLVDINRTVTGGRLEIISPSDTGAFSIIDSFPVQNSKRIEASIYINENVNGLKIRLISGEQILVETGLNPEPKIFPGNLILAVKVPASTQHVIECALLPKEPVLVTPVQLGELPGTALNYDGVSGLALTDPGPVLSPAQVQALKAWLAGGGRMVLGAARSNRDSLLSALGIDSEDSDRSFYQIGFGGITTLRREFNDLKLNANEWQGLLNLGPFTTISWPRVNGLFPKLKANSSIDSRREPSKAASYLTMILILWIISGLAIVIPAKRSRVSLLICFTLLWTIAAFPIGNWLAGFWNRGAEIHSRTIIFPESGWMLTNVKVQLTSLNKGKTEYFKSSPWGGRVSLGKDNHGIIEAGSRSREFVWEHRLSFSQAAVKIAGPGWVNASAWFPLKRKYSGKIGEITALKTMFGQETVVWDGKEFYMSQGFSLPGKQGEKIEQIPDWLQEENEWLTILNRFNPGSPWLIGHGSLPDIDFKIENNGYSESLWALPLSKGAQK